MIQNACCRDKLLNTRRRILRVVNGEVTPVIAITFTCNSIKSRDVRSDGRLQVCACLFLTLRIRGAEHIYI